MLRRAMREHDPDLHLDSSRTAQVAPQLDTLSDRVHELEEERVPTISTVAHTGLRSVGIGAHLMWEELEVGNTSPTQPLENTQVRIISCDHIAPAQDLPGVYKNLGAFMWDWSPITLQWAQSASDTVVIPGGVSRTVLVAFSDDSNGPPAVFNDSNHTRCSLELKIEVEVSSPSSATLHSSYFIQCHPNYWGGQSARFEFMPWEEWVSTRTVIDVGATESEPDTADSQNGGVC